MALSSAIELFRQVAKSWSQSRHPPVFSASSTFAATSSPARMQSGQHLSSAFNRHAEFRHSGYDNATAAVSPQYGAREFGRIITESDSRLFASASGNFMVVSLIRGCDSLRIRNGNSGNVRRRRLWTGESSSPHGIEHSLKRLVKRFCVAERPLQICEPLQIGFHQAGPFKPENRSISRLDEALTTRTGGPLNTSVDERAATSGVGT